MSSLYPIIYRGFYDVPRMIFVNAESTFLLDCDFDEDLDDYPDEYEVFLVEDSLEGKLDGSWIDLDLQLKFLGKVKIADVTFDETKRKMIDLSFLAKLL